MQVQVGGDFLLTHADMQRPLLFLAGGIGITPMMSMLSHYVEMVQAANRIITGLHQCVCNGSTCQHSSCILDIASISEIRRQSDAHAGT